MRRDQKAERKEEDSDAQEERRTLAVHPAGRDEDLAQARRRATRRGSAGRHVVRVNPKTRSARITPRTSVVSPGLSSSTMSPREPVCDRGAEEARCAGPEETARRDGVAPVAPAGRPFDRLRPLLLHVRPGRAVEERSLQLAPPPLEGDPRKPSLGPDRIARHRLGRRDGTGCAARACRRSPLQPPPSCRGRAPA